MCCLTDTSILDLLTQQKKDEYEDRQISWKCSRTSCNISILAIPENDGLIIGCGNGECSTVEVVVYVVEGEVVYVTVWLCTVYND